MNYTIEELNKLALKSVSEASEILLKSSESYVIESKMNERDLVTDIEKVIERYLTESLQVSNINVVGEELSSKNKVDTDMNWWVDPIDGTNNFIAGLSSYAISVGLMKKNEFIVGAVGAPQLKEIYFTYNSEAAFCNGRKISSVPKSLKQSIVGVSFCKDSDLSMTNQYSIFGKINEASRSAHRTGSAALNICNVASSKFGAAYGFDAYLWDVAGGIAIAQASKCKIKIKRKGDCKIDYLVSNAESFENLLEIAGI